MITRLAQNAAVHVAFAFFLMGSWALYTNSAHPNPKPIIAGLVQGVLSGTITYGLKRTLDALRSQVTHGNGWWVPPLIALSVSLCLLIAAHVLAGTPEVAQTIILPFSVASLYAVTYNFLMWNKDKTR